LRVADAERYLREKKLADLVAKYKREVYDKADELAHATWPPSRLELDWNSVTIGWALANGQSPAEASLFAKHVRFKCGLIPNAVL
jgi:hypothetical protein